jgi:hypothetical protein
VRRLGVLGPLVLLAACNGRIGDEGAGRAPSGAPGGPPVAEPSAPPGPPPVRCDRPFVGARAMVRLTAQELANTLRDVFPEARDAFTLDIADPLETRDGFVRPGSLLVGQDSADKLVTAAKAIADVVVAPANLGLAFPCVAGARDAGCAGAVIERFGRRLFRRPLTGEEKQRYEQLARAVASKSDFGQGLKWALVALVQSPHTLYRWQIGQPAGGGLYRLRPWELASELAYTFTGTAPSEALLARAEGGALASPEALVSEARALLATPAGRRTMDDYFRRWLGYDLVSANQRDGVAGFAELRDELAEETRVFVDRIVHIERGGLRELLTAPYTTIDGPLATYYGFPAPGGQGYGVVTRPPGQGIGLLAQGSLLAERSQSLNSSPTRRGILVRQKLLCLEIPQQPAVVPDLPAPGTGWRTTRQRFETAHAQGACAACHRFFDPLGFPFERFDEGGRFRATENGEPIDASGHALDDAGQAMFSVEDGQEELATLLAGRPDVAACVAETLTKYLSGQNQHCVAGEARNEFVEGKIGFYELAARLAGAPHFSQRRD